MPWGRSVCFARGGVVVIRTTGACLVACCLSAAAHGQEARPIPRQVRSTTRWGLDLVAEGRQKSASFRRIVDALQQTDVVVYVQPAEQLPGGTEAVTELIATTGPARYLRVWIGLRAVRKRLIALLGHELQHALEIGRAPEVVDSATLEAFYRKAGERSVGGYETQAAREVGDTVYDELWRYRSAPNADAPGPAVLPARPVDLPRINITVIPR